MPPNIAIHLIRHLKAAFLPKYALRPGDGERSTDAMARLGYPQVKKEIDFTLSAE
jgi:hypothetical protein